MISGPQCRAARGLLGISQQELAKAAGVGHRTIVEFENEMRQHLSQTREVIQRALEAKGIEFIGDRGVQLKQTTGKG